MSEQATSKMLAAGLFQQPALRAHEDGTTACTSSMKSQDGRERTVNAIALHGGSCERRRVITPARPRHAWKSRIIQIFGAFSLLLALAAFFRWGLPTYPEALPAAEADTIHGAHLLGDALTSRDTLSTKRRLLDGFATTPTQPRLKQLAQDAAGRYVVEAPLPRWVAAGGMTLAPGATNFARVQTASALVMALALTLLLLAGPCRTWFGRLALGTSLLAMEGAMDAAHSGGYGASSLLAMVLFLLALTRVTTARRGTLALGVTIGLVGAVHPLGFALLVTTFITFAIGQRALGRTPTFAAQGGFHLAESCPPIPTTGPANATSRDLLDKPALEVLPTLPTSRLNPNSDRTSNNSNSSYITAYSIEFLRTDPAAMTRAPDLVGSAAASTLPPSVDSQATSNDLAPADGAAASTLPPSVDSQATSNDLAPADGAAASTLPPSVDSQAAPNDPDPSNGAVASALPRNTVPAPPVGCLTPPAAPVGLYLIPIVALLTLVALWPALWTNTPKRLGAWFLGFGIAPTPPEHIAGYLFDQSVARAPQAFTALLQWFAATPWPSLVLVALGVLAHFTGRRVGENAQHDAITGSTQKSAHARTVQTATVAALLTLGVMLAAAGLDGGLNGARLDLAPLLWAPTAILAGLGAEWAAQRLSARKTSTRAWAVQLGVTLFAASALVFVVMPQWRWPRQIGASSRAPLPLGLLANLTTAHENAVSPTLSVIIGDVPAAWEPGLKVAHDEAGLPIIAGPANEATWLWVTQVPGGAPSASPNTQRLGQRDLAGLRISIWKTPSIQGPTPESARP